MAAFITQFRTRISMLLMLLIMLVVVLLLVICFIAMFPVEQPLVRNTDIYSIQKEQNYLDVLENVDNYTDSGEFSVYIVIGIMCINV
jgi:ABC-type glycerol-3-phosphate transport system permease component